LVATPDREDGVRALRLHAAFQSGDFATLARELGDRPDFPNVIVHDGFGSCLTYAVYHGPLRLVAALLDAGADPNWPSDDGFPPLIAAVTTSEPEPGATVRDDTDQLVELLLAHGADANQRGFDDYTPLHVAAAQGDLGVVEILLAHGADPCATTRVDDYETALEVAQAAGHAAVVARLEPLTTRPGWGRAAKSGDLPELKRLRAQGHQLDTTDGFGATALMSAAHAGHLDVVEWLVEQGAALDRSAKYHLTALMLAAVGGHHEVVRRLIAAGADTSVTGTGAPGFAGKTAADLADDRGDRSLATYIRTKGQASSGTHAPRDRSD
jgi:ankyrin repeat protein